MNKINFEYFNSKKEIEEEKKEIKKIEINSKIEIIFNELKYNFSFSGVKLIKANNTNKFIRNILTDNEKNSNLKIDGVDIKNKDIIIISPFTKISDILSSKTNGNLHSFLKDKNLLQKNSLIEEAISTSYKEINDILELTNIDLTKVDLINYIDISDNFLSHDNIDLVFNILKTNQSKRLIVFNDVNYLNLENVSEYFPFFHFIYVFNEYEKEYSNIDNYEEHSLFIVDNKINDWYQNQQ